MATPSVDPQAKRPDGMVLQPDNADQYWRGAWDTNSTGWKAFEADRSIFSKNIAGLEETLKEVSDASNGTPLMAGNESIFEQHRGAFVPLCGDTYATRFLVDGFLKCGCDSALKQIRCDGGGDAAEKKMFDALGAAALNPDTNESLPLHFVMGVDLAAEGIQLNMKVNFPEVVFDVICHKDDDEVEGVTAASFTHYFARVINPNNYSKLVDGAVVDYADVHLFVGDYFAVTKWWMGKALKGAASSAVAASAAIPYAYFDFTYDRASMMAMHPLLRQQYVDAIVGLYGPSTATAGSAAAKGAPPQRGFLELCARAPEIRHLGPPFHIDPSAVATPLIGADAEAAPNTAADATPLPFYPAPQWKYVPLKFQIEMPPNFKFVKYALVKCE